MTKLKSISRKKNPMSEEKKTNKQTIQPNDHLINLKFYGF